MKVLNLFILLLCFPLVSKAQKLTKISIPNTSIRMSIPVDFIEMDDYTYQRKYEAYLSPAAKYTGPSGNADFIVNVRINYHPDAYSKAPIEDLEVMYQMYRTTIMNSHTKVEFTQDKIAKINKHNFIIFEFVGDIQDVNRQGEYSGVALSKYYYLLYTIKGGDVYIFNFNCPNRDKEKWEAAVQKSMKSIKI